MDNVKVLYSQACDYFMISYMVSSEKTKYGLNFREESDKFLMIFKNFILEVDESL